VIASKSLVRMGLGCTLAGIVVYNVQALQAKSQSTMQPEVLTISELRLVNAKGAVVAILGTEGATGLPFLRMFAPMCQAEPVAQISINAIGSPAGGPVTEAGVVSLLELSTDYAGQYAASRLMSGQGHSMLSLLNQSDDLDSAATISASREQVTLDIDIESNGDRPAFITFDIKSGVASGKARNEGEDQHAIWGHEK